MGLLTCEHLLPGFSLSLEELFSQLDRQEG
jgi:hypothetical protein